MRISRDSFANFVTEFRTTKYFARLSRDVLVSVMNLSPRNYGEIQFTMQNFCDTSKNVVQVSHDGRATVLRKHANTSRLSGEKIKLSDINVQHSHNCRATVVQIKMKISYICEKVVRHSHECRKTVMRQLGDYRATVARYIFKIRLKFANLLHKCLFSETTT